MCCTKRRRKDDPPLDLLPRLFDRMKRGVWFRVLPTEDTFDDIYDAMNQDWDDLLPLLIDHGLLACDIRDDVKNYKFITKRDTRHATHPSDESWCASDMVHMSGQP
jgi:hypothetical protein